MSTFVLDAATASALQTAVPGTVLLGPDGRVVGRFVPPNVAHDLDGFLAERKRRYDEAWESFDIEELKAAEAEGGGIPHEEVVKRLGLE